jgi:serine/threonine protein kinase
MERLYGTTLREQVRSRGALPVGEAVRHTRQVLSALRAVHEAGLVPRDVKPDNVMVCDRGRAGTRVKLLDFGIAKVKSGARARIVPLAIPTRDGLCVGTPRYVAPEQASGALVDPRTDIYAAGLLLYVLVAGRGPFDEIKGAEHLLRAHQDLLPPPPSRMAPSAIPAALESVILRAIAKNPADRFNDAASFARSLDLVAPSLRERRGADGSRSALENAPTVRQFSFVHAQASTFAGVPLAEASRETIKPTVLLTACVRGRRLAHLARWFWGTGLIFASAATGAVIGALAMWWFG